MKPRQLFIRKNGIIVGPFPFQQLEEMASQGRLAAEDLLSPDKTEWSPASKYIPQLAPADEEPSPIVLPTPIETPQPSSGQPPQAPMAIEVPYDDAPPPPEELFAHQAGNADWWEPLPPKQPRLWLFCHLVCAIFRWDSHASVLLTRFRAAIWLSIAYSLLAGIVPAALFATCYPAMHFSRLNGCVMAFMALLLAAAASFLTVARCLRAACHHDWRIGTLAALSLLSLCATVFGTAAALLQAAGNPGIPGKLAATAVILFAEAVFAVGSLRLLSGLGSFSLKLPQKAIRRYWLVWLIETLLLSAAFRLFLA